MWQGKNCNCTKQEVADLVGLLINDESGVVDVSSENTAATEDICTVPHGFVSEPLAPSCLRACWHGAGAWQLQAAPLQLVLTS